MGRDDWFRNSDWNDQIEAEFEQRLRRARQTFQYLRIQAQCLARKHPAVALRLLERYFALGENADMALAYGAKAQAMLALGDLEGALAAYEAALERERRMPHLQTQASVDFPRLVVETGSEAHYARALEVLDDRTDRPRFPVERYQAHGARALILAHFGRTAEARTEAHAAMDAAREGVSGFRHHPNLGLVPALDTPFDERVAALAT